MSRFMDASELPTSPARVPADDALWAELYFPRVEDLLRRLAQAEKNKRYSLQALLFGSWPITTGIIIALICLPGCATGAILLMAAGSLDVPRVTAEEQILGKADRLALVETKVRNPVAPAEISPPLMAFAQEAALPDAVSLRGTLQSAALTASTAPQPAQTASPRLARRSVGKPVSLKPPAVHPEAAPQPPALLQKLFGFVVPATALPSQPDQHQT
jgi:hypothetical protein